MSIWSNFAIFFFGIVQPLAHPKKKCGVVLSIYKHTYKGLNSFFFFFFCAWEHSCECALVLSGTGWVDVNWGLARRAPATRRHEEKRKKKTGMGLCCDAACCKKKHTLQMSNKRRKGQWHAAIARERVRERHKRCFHSLQPVLPFMGHQSQTGMKRRIWALWRLTPRVIRSCPARCDLKTAINCSIDKSIPERDVTGTVMITSIMGRSTELTFLLLISFGGAWSAVPVLAVTSL